MRCLRCQHENSDAAIFCAKCGLKQETPSQEQVVSSAAIPACPQCGEASHKAGAKFCIKCGRRFGMSRPHKMLMIVAVIVLLAVLAGLDVGMKNILNSSTTGSAVASRSSMPALTGKQEPASAVASGLHGDASRSLASKPVAKLRTIDEVFRKRAALECTRWWNSLLCKEGLKMDLCKGHWSEKPQPGQTVCLRRKTSPND